MQSAREIEELGREWIGVTPSRVDLLYGEYDRNVLVELPSGERFVLKLMRDAEPDTVSLVELQIAILEHLGGAAGSVECPEVIARRDGDVSVVCDVDGTPRVAWMLRYIDGDLLDARTTYSVPLLESIGAAVAEVDRSLEEFQDERAERSLLWDVARADDVATWTTFVADSGDRSVAERAFAAFRDVVAPRLQEVPRSIIHNDGGNQHNMVLAGKDAIRGIIDFGDVVATPTVCGAGVAAAYAAFGVDDPVRALTEVARGYAKVRPLTDSEVQLVPGLARTRLAMSAVIAARRSHERPDDPYATVSAEGAWRVLRWFDEAEMPELVDRTREATGG